MMKKKCSVLLAIVMLGFTTPSFAQVTLDISVADIPIDITIDDDGIDVDAELNSALAILDGFGGLTSLGDKGPSVLSDVIGGGGKVKFNTDEEPEVEENTFIELGVKAVPLRNQNASDFSEVNRALEGTSFALTGVSAAMNYGEDDTTPADGTRMLNYVAPEERELNAMTFESTTGQMGVLGSNVYREMIDASVGAASGSPMTEWMATLAQTSPALMGAAVNSFKIAGEQVKLQYAAQESFSKQLESLSPWARNQVQNATQRCMHRNIQAGKLWIEAQQTCYGFDVFEALDRGGSFTATTSDSEGEDGMWDLKSHHTSRENGTISYKVTGDRNDPDNRFVEAREADDECVSIADQLFGPMMNEAGGDMDAPIFGLFKSWVEMYGDIEFCPDIAARSDIAQRASTGFKLRKIEESYAPAEMLVDMTRRRFVGVMHLMQRYCDYQVEQMTAPASTGACSLANIPFWTSPKGVIPGPTCSGGNYVPPTALSTENEENQETVRLLSTEGYEFNAALLELLYGQFTKQNNIRNAGVTANVCRNIASAAQLRSDLDAGTQAAVSNVYKYAKMIAYGQMLSSYRQSASFVTQRAVEPGKDKLNLRETALNMVYETAGTDDIAGIQVENHKALREFMKGLAVERTQQGGQMFKVSESLRQRLKQ